MRQAAAVETPVDGASLEAVVHRLQVDDDDRCVRGVSEVLHVVCSHHDGVAFGNSVANIDSIDQVVDPLAIWSPRREPEHAVSDRPVGKGGYHVDWHVGSICGHEQGEALVNLLPSGVRR